MTEQQRVVVGDIEVAYTRIGVEGAPRLVLVHGIAQTGMDCWAEQVDHLARECDCFVLDLRGHGGTTLGDAEATLEQLGGDVLGFLEAVAGPSTVIGFSLGATIALWATAQGTPLITRVIAMGGSSVMSRGAAAVFAERAAWVRDGQLELVHAALREETAGMFVASPQRAEDAAERRIAAIGAGAGYANACLAMARMREHPLQPLLADVECRVDVVGGERDAWCPRKASDIVMEGLAAGDGARAAARFSEVAGAGHLMASDEPEQVTALLGDLLAQ